MEEVPQHEVALLLGAGWVQPTVTEDWSGHRRGKNRINRIEQSENGLNMFEHVFDVDLIPAPRPQGSMQFKLRTIFEARHSFADRSKGFNEFQ